jgi:shikimate dehydrogenase
MKEFGLIGYPLGHSFSKKYFTQKFEKENISDARYELFPLPDIAEFNTLIRKRPQLKGLSVTIPHKEVVIPFLDELSEEAKVIGAVNTIKITRNQNIIHAKGHNTDVFGFTKSLKETGRNFHQALILGSGGASKAVAYALAKTGIQYHTVTRNKKNKSKEFLAYNELDKSLIQNSDLIINTTPLGTFPNPEQAPDIPYKHITDNHFLFDLVYNPSETLFMKKGKTQGAVVKNGLMMLHYQADKAAEIFKIGK